MKSPKVVKWNGDKKKNSNGLSFTVEVRDIRELSFLYELLTGDRMQTNPIMEELRNSEGAKETRIEMDLREAFAECCPFYMSGKCFDEFGMPKEEKMCDLGCERGRQFGEKINKILTDN